MNLIDALERLKQPMPEEATSLRVFLACGFTPLHLETFLAAHLRDLRPACRIEIGSGLFGDLAGNLERLLPDDHDAIAVIIEWSDLDPRLGLRSLGGWQVEKLPDILSSAGQSLKRLTAALRALASLPCCVSLPTLPLPPLFHTGSEQSSRFELALRRSIAAFAETISERERLSIISGQTLDEASPLAKRFDLRSELASGFPYKTLHASALGELMAKLLARKQPKKGLITDLDDTLWSGLLGEVGVDGIRWDLEGNAQLHGIYQQFLASLASAGVLVGVASKNESALVEQAFTRDDLLLAGSSVFPIEANWGMKSESVRRILSRWNILPDSVVFVDDSPMEIAEVQRAFPEMECLLFPKDDYAAFWQFVHALRDRFAKVSISKEDSLRLTSIRAADALQDPGKGRSDSLDDFLQEAKGRLIFDLGKPVSDTRAFELVNKTNQFNLNGKRYDAATWARFLQDSGTIVLTVSYEDKFGKLGRIAVLMGSLSKETLILQSWVMSCRAFSRRIEFHCLQYMFEKFGVNQIVFEVTITPRNGPFVEFLRQLTDASPETNPQLSKFGFLTKAPKMPHQVEEISAYE